MMIVDSGLLFWATLYILLVTRTSFKLLSEPIKWSTYEPRWKFCCSVFGWNVVV